MNEETYEKNIYKELKCDSIHEEEKVESNEEEKLKKEQAKVSEIKELGTNNMTGPDQSVQILPIIGQIEGQ